MAQSSDHTAFRSHMLYNAHTHTHSIAANLEWETAKAHVTYAVPIESKFQANDCGLRLTIAIGKNQRKLNCICRIGKLCNCARARMEWIACEESPSQEFCQFCRLRCLHKNEQCKNPTLNEGMNKQIKKSVRSKNWAICQQRICSVAVVLCLDWRIIYFLSFLVCHILFLCVLKRGTHCRRLWLCGMRHDRLAMDSKTKTVEIHANERCGCCCATWKTSQKWANRFDDAIFEYRTPNNTSTDWPSFVRCLSVSIVRTEYCCASCCATTTSTITQMNIYLCSHTRTSDTHTSARDYCVDVFV